jgi:hypothetical protein
MRKNTSLRRFPLAAWCVIVCLLLAEAAMTAHLSHGDHDPGECPVCVFTALAVVLPALVLVCAVARFARTVPLSPVAVHAHRGVGTAFSPRAPPHSFR